LAEKMYYFRSKIAIKNHLRLKIKTDGCMKDKKTHVKYLEHVQAIVTISAVVRGDIQIYLTSPEGSLNINLNSESLKRKF
jgi:subtilisin-like proprotein convertase family protein